MQIVTMYSCLSLNQDTLLKEGIIDLPLKYTGIQHKSSQDLCQFENVQTVM